MFDRTTTRPSGSVPPLAMRASSAKSSWFPSINHSSALTVVRAAVTEPRYRLPSASGQIPKSPS
jgi:hypothetical protein